MMCMLHIELIGNFMVLFRCGTDLEESALNVNLEEFMTTKKVIFLVLVSILLAGYLFAEGDMVAMLAKTNYTLSVEDPTIGEFNDPFDYYDFLILMSNNGSYQVPYLIYDLPTALQYKDNDNGYGVIYYADGSNLIGPDEYYNEYDCQRFFCRGSKKYYDSDTLRIDADNGEQMNAAYYWTTNVRDFDPLKLKQPAENDVKTILGHVSESTSYEGNHPFTFEDSSLSTSITYSFIADCNLDNTCRSAIQDFLNDACDWFYYHDFNNNVLENNGTVDEFFFHYLMYWIEECDGDVVNGIQIALNQTDVDGFNLRECLISSEMGANGTYEDVCNFVLSDGDNLYIFKNSQEDDTRHMISYKDCGDFYGVKTLSPDNSTAINQFELVALSRNSLPETYEVYRSYLPSSISEIGQAVAIYGDYAAASYDNGVITYKKNSNDIWVYDQTIPTNFHPVNSNTDFGAHISMNGNYMAIGAPLFNEHVNGTVVGYQCGAVFIYEINTSTGNWDYIDKVYGWNYERIGSSFEIDIDGNLVVGIPRYDSATLNDVGKVIYYEYDEIPDQYLIVHTWYGDGPFQQLGYDVDISDHGIIIAGSPERTIQEIGGYYLYVGAVSFFNSDGDSLVNRNSYSLYNNCGCNDYGKKVAIDKRIEAFPMCTGNYGFYFGNIPNIDYVGSAVYYRQSTDDRIHLNNNPGYPFSVYTVNPAPPVNCIEKDGERAFISCEDYVYVYTESGSTICDTFSSHYSGTDDFGTSMNYDGSTIIVGAPSDPSGGAVYFFDYSSASGGGRPELLSDAPEVKSALTVKGNYPNPFNPTTVIKYSLTDESNVEVSVYNLKGQKVNTLVKDKQSSGDHEVVWNGEDSNGSAVSSGVYFYKIQTSKDTKISKMVLMK